jgi:RNA polymerase sigma-70 factor (ECF subfamily)
VTNYCLDQIRWYKSHPVTSLEGQDKDTGEEVEDSGWMRDESSSPEQILEQVELSETINLCLLKLSPEYRTPIILIDIQEIAYQEAAEIMDLPLGSFKSRLFRGRLKLQELIRKSQVWFLD